MKSIDQSEAENEIWRCFHSLRNIIKTIDEPETIHILTTTIPTITREASEKER